MSSALLILALLTPLLTLVFVFTRIGGPLTVVAALPALAAAIAVPAGTSIDIPWLLLGTRLGLDANAGIFLLFTSLLWMVAAAHAASQLQVDVNAVRFRIFYLLAMSGNFILVLGQDLISFYLGFALMGLAAYGLVVHDGTPLARRAGRIYLVMTLVAEFALLFAFVMMYWRTGTLSPNHAQLIGAGMLELGLLMLAFGIKAGVIGLHLWLPLAHPAAPVPASAVLSGAMIKTALIGWMRYLPFGHESLPEWGLLLLIAGAAGALLALPLGLPQTNPKVVLAYSSVGKMGSMVCALGLALIEPSAAPAIIAAVTLFAAHHGLTKGALFLGFGVVKSSSSPWAFSLLVFPALALAGLPFTTGALAKEFLSLSVLGVAEKWSWVFFWLLPIAALSTALLMARFLYLMSGLAERKSSFPLLPALPWLGLLTVILLTPLAYDGLPSPVKNSWPIAIAAATAILVTRARPALLTSLVGRIPPGDLIVPLSNLTARLVAAYRLSRGRLRAANEAG